MMNVPTPGLILCRLKEDCVIVVLALGRVEGLEEGVHIHVADVHGQFAHPTLHQGWDDHWMSSLTLIIKIGVQTTKFRRNIVTTKEKYYHSEK